MTDSIGRAAASLAWSPRCSSTFYCRPRRRTRPRSADARRSDRAGLANSQRLAELQARQEAAAAVAARRGPTGFPSPRCSGGYTRTNHVERVRARADRPGRYRVLYPDIPDNYRTRLDLQWPIYTGGRTDALERAARAERDAAGEDLAAARADLRLEITRAFWALVTAREPSGRARAIARAHRRARRAICAPGSTRGSIPPNDVLSAEAQRVAPAAAGDRSANTTARCAEADLRRLLGDRRGADTHRARGGLRMHRQRAGRPTAARRARTREPRRSAARSSQRVAAAGAPHRRGRGGTAAAGRRGRRLRLRPAQPAHLSARRRLGGLLGRVGQRDLVALGRRPHPRREGPRPRPTPAPRRRGPLDFDRQIAFEVRQRRSSSTRAAPPSRSRPTASAPRSEARRVVGERFAPASPRAPRCSTRRPPCCRPSWHARARSPTPGSPRRASSGRWGDTIGIGNRKSARRSERRESEIGARARTSEIGRRKSEMAALMHRERHRRPAPDAPLRRVRRRRRPVVRRAARRDLRLSRQQRRRQVDDDPHAVRAAPADIRHRDRRRRRRRPGIRKASSSASATCRSASRSTSC